MNEKELRQKVVETAIGYLGAVQGSKKHKSIIDTFNKSGLCKRYKMTYNDAWCQAFASTIGILCDMSDIIPVECSCPKAIKLWQKLGRWQEKDSYVPNIGDFIYYDWQDDGIGDNKGASDHVGIVVGVTSKTIKVIEGNYSTLKKVAYRTINIDGKFIRGFGLPNYAKKVTKEPAKKPTTSKEPVKKPSKEPVKTAISAKSFDKKLSGNYVTTSKLNLRTKPGVLNDETLMLTIPKNDKVVCYGYYTLVDGVKWYLVVYKDTVGFCSSKYLKKA